jgi:hypothetical protein
MNPILQVRLAFRSLVNSGMLVLLLFSFLRGNECVEFSGVAICEVMWFLR